MTISGTHAGLTVSGTITLFDLSYNAFTSDLAGKYIQLTGSATYRNNKTFYISAFLDSAHLQLQSTFGATADASQGIQWSIFDTGDGRPNYGAGIHRASLGPAGFDPIKKSSASVIVSSDEVNTAAYYDLGTRSFPRDASGAVKRLHWVDQAVGLALGVSNGAVGSQTSLGNKLRTIKRNDPLRIEAQVKDAVKVSIKDLIDRKDIVVTNVQVLQAIRSQIMVVVQYINLRTTQVDTNLISNITFSF